MATFICIPGGLEQVWACISPLHLYCDCLEMIKAQFLIDQGFLGLDIIKKLKNVISGNPTPQTANIIKDKLDNDLCQL